jgi:deferrochelatase/peroxidase EfeB
MKRKDDSTPIASRRGFLTSAAGIAAITGTGIGTDVLAAGSADAAVRSAPKGQTEPFWGPHQGGILTPQQKHTYFAAFDLVTDQQGDIAKLLQSWTLAAERMTTGQTAQAMDGGLSPAVVRVNTQAYGSHATPDPATLAGDTGEALDLNPARLTVTFGFGPGLFVKDGNDRYGLAHLRPEALVDMPKFASDQLVEAQTGGDLSVQACADDPQVAFHAIRQLARLADGSAQIRWVQTGFLPNAGSSGTPRNLMGFKDGTINPPPRDPKAMEQFVWAGTEGPNWIRGGSYMVVRRIRIALEHWDQMKVAFQEQAVGRHKYTGAPLGKKNERDELDLKATDSDGNLVVPENAHVRLAAAATNDGAQILRRPYSYNVGADVIAERWPPWRQALEYDAGLFFVCYQRDPRIGFIKIYEKMSKFDTMNQFVTHVGGGLFACPRGAAQGEYIGQNLLQSA